MTKKTNWLIWLIAIIAVVALVLAILAFTRASMTGNALFSWFKPTTVTVTDKGLLGNAYGSSGGDLTKLKNYEVKYGPNGDLVYEIIGGVKILVGDNYKFIQTGEDDAQILSVFGGGAVSMGGCGCPPGMTSSSDFPCKIDYEISGCAGHCSSSTAGNASPCFAHYGSDFL